MPGGTGLGRAGHVIDQHVEQRRPIRRRADLQIVEQGRERVIAMGQRTATRLGRAREQIGRTILPRGLTAKQQRVDVTADL